MGARSPSGGGVNIVSRQRPPWELPEAGRARGVGAGGIPPGWGGGLYVGGGRSMGHAPQHQHPLLLSRRQCFVPHCAVSVT